MDKMTDQELKPCPFCGEQPILFPSGDGSGVMIECQTKGCINPHVSYYGNGIALSKWNNRAPSRLQSAPDAGVTDPLEREKMFQRWWKASKYCQVIYPEPHLEQYARDGFNAALALTTPKPQAVKDASYVVSVICDFLDADDGTHWGDFEKALAGAVNYDGDTLTPAPTPASGEQMKGVAAAVKRMGEVGHDSTLIDQRADEDLARDNSNENPNVGQPASGEPDGFQYVEAERQRAAGLSNSMKEKASCRKFRKN